MPRAVITVRFELDEPESDLFEGTPNHLAKALDLAERAIAERLFGAGFLPAGMTIASWDVSGDIERSSGDPAD